MKPDFASLLDEILAENDGPVAAPNVMVDCLAVLDELHSGRVRISEEEVVAGYRETGFADTTTDELERAAARMRAPADRESIARELCLTEIRSIQELDRLRRSFAMGNHPDRVAPVLRDIAMQRMQIANMLIDEARRRFVSAR